MNKTEIESNEELWMMWYLEELLEKKIIESFTFNTESIVLNKELEINYVSPRKRIADKVLTQVIIPRKVYTPDFKLIWNQEFFNSSPFKLHFLPTVQAYDMTSILEVKGTWDQNNMTRLFKQNQAYIWDKHGLFIQLVKLPDLFAKTFTPKRYLLTNKTMKPRIIKHEVKLLDEFLLQDTYGTPRIR